MSPYRLPDGYVQIAFSGGRTSAYMLHAILEANGTLPDRVQVTFQNTGREMPATLDFVAECGERWGVPIRWLEYSPRQPLHKHEIALLRAVFGDDYAERIISWWSQHDDNGFRHVSHNSAARNGEPFVALVLQRKYLPNQQARYCTMELKVRTAKKYLRSLGWDYWTNGVGLRADEPKRLKPEGVKLPRDRWSVWQPLANAGVSKHDVAAFWRGQPFDLSLPNVGGKCWLGNCDACFLKSEANLSALARDYPERHAWWEQMEALASSLTSGTGGTFSKRYCRRELREFTERQSDAFDLEGGVLCQADDGECMM